MEFVSRYTSGLPLIRCPFCDPQENAAADAAHPIRVVVNAGGSITTVDHEGTRMKAGEPAGRGVAIALEFGCECGHT